MAVHRWDDIKRRKLSPERLASIEARADQEVLEMNLRAVRELVGMTQVEAATSAEMTQSELSKTERRGDRRLSTLRRYIQALGGELEIFAVFGDKRVRLKGI
jgi:DNA-binding phage protein